jgi:hypothetical protein
MEFANVHLSLKFGLTRTVSTVSTSIILPTIALPNNKISYKYKNCCNILSCFVSVAYSYKERKRYNSGKMKGGLEVLQL